MGYIENVYIGSMTIYILSTLIVIGFMIKSPAYRSPITITALFSTLTALIYSVMIVIWGLNPESVYNMSRVMTAFYIISTSLAFVPGLVGFHRISRETGSKIGTIFAMVGYLWAFVLIVMVIAINVMIAKNFLSVSEDTLDAIFYGHSGHAFLVIVLYLMTQHHLHGMAKGSLLAYTLLFVQYEIFFYVLTYAVEDTNMYSALALVFNDLVMALALVVSVIYGHLWTTKRDSNRGDVYDKVEVALGENSKW
ncbi:hypothetical protein INT47_013188 [Mucor saturninus]|uniref:Uncharacterized protein n=1 Tax=Mucor saturninus TaxID=64648 RepID=A0A8H7QKF8_9FUNG|nr:hypothetical protein INT47_013188 [Mucor saturninus]